MVNVSTYYGTRDDIAPNDKTTNNIITNCRISNAKKLTTNECDIISNDHNPECDATCSNSKKGIFCSVVVAESDPPDSTSLCGAQADIIQLLIKLQLQCFGSLFPKPGSSQKSQSGSRRSLNLDPSYFLTLSENSIKLFHSKRFSHQKKLFCVC